MGWSFDPRNGRTSGSSGVGGFIVLLIILVALFVNSAHERYDPLQYKKPISFKFILLNRYQGKEIKVPR